MSLAPGTLVAGSLHAVSLPLGRATVGRTVGRRGGRVGRRAGRRGGGTRVTKTDIEVHIHIAMGSGEV